jgi:hypothetical protein
MEISESSLRVATTSEQRDAGRDAYSLPRAVSFGSRVEHTPTVRPAASGVLTHPRVGAVEDRRPHVRRTTD